MHMANAKSLVQSKEFESFEYCYKLFAENYTKAMEYMDGRGPGKNTVEAVSQLLNGKYKLPFNER